jgi:hypothetical protein
MKIEADPVRRPARPHPVLDRRLPLRAAPLHGEGAHPPADACDFARHCSALDFFSINDHAEGITPERWQATVESLRECDARAGDPADPDLVPFLGWEWTQMGATSPSALRTQERGAARARGRRDHRRGPSPSGRRRTWSAAPPGAAPAAGEALARLAGAPTPTSCGGCAGCSTCRLRSRRASPELPPTASRAPTRRTCCSGSSTSGRWTASSSRTGWPGAPRAARRAHRPQLTPALHDPDGSGCSRCSRATATARSIRGVRRPDAGAPDGVRPARRRPERLRPAAGAPARSCARAAATCPRPSASAGGARRARWRSRRAAARTGASRHRPEDWLDCDQCRDCFKPALTPRPG